jgi:hypothetical protein
MQSRIVAATLMAVLSPSVSLRAQSIGHGIVSTKNQAPGVWVDPSTKLMWAGKDNGKDINWRRAMKYCHSLRLNQYSDWRLANAVELQGIYDEALETPGLSGSGKTQEAFNYHVKGNLFLTGDEWIGHQVTGRMPLESYENHFDFNEGRAVVDPTGWPYPHAGLRALCVRGPER